MLAASITLTTLSPPSGSVVPVKTADVTELLVQEVTLFSLLNNKFLTSSVGTGKVGKISFSVELFGNNIKLASSRIFLFCNSVKSVTEQDSPSNVTPFFNVIIEIKFFKFCIIVFTKLPPKANNIILLKLIYYVLWFIA